MTDPASPTAAPHPSGDASARRLVRHTLAKWPFILACAFVAAIVAFAASSARSNQYESTTTIQVRDSDLVGLFLQQTTQSSQLSPQQQAASNAQLIEQPDVYDRAAATLGHGFTSKRVKDSLTVTTSADTDLLGVTARDADPDTARAISAAITNAFIAQRTNEARAQLDQAEQLVQKRYDALSDAQRRSATGLLLADRLQQVGVVGSLTNGNVQIVQGARTPPDPVSPRPKRDAVLGLFGGLLLGIALAATRAGRDGRVRDLDELAETWDLPIVGLIPQTEGLGKSGPKMPDAAALEALSLARTNLRYLNAGGGARTVLITSALPAEGKSTITWNLALAAVAGGGRALVIEADLRRPVMGARLGFSGQHGLSEVLAGIAKITDVITSVEVPARNPKDPALVVDVLPAGLTPPNPLALLDGPVLGNAVAEIRDDYDLVLIDTPPGSIVADALAMTPVVDGVLIVSRLGTARAAALSRLRTLMTSAHAPVLGMIVNSEESAGEYSYSSYTSTPVEV